MASNLYTPQSLSISPMLLLFLVKIRPSTYLFSTVIITIDSPLEERNFTFAFELPLGEQERIGFGAFLKHKSNQIEYFNDISGLSVSYKVLNRDFDVILGSSVQYTYYIIDTTQFVFGDQIDPRHGVVYKTQQTGLRNNFYCYSYTPSIRLKYKDLHLCYTHNNLVNIWSTESFQPLNYSQIDAMYYWQSFLFPQ